MRGGLMMLALAAVLIMPASGFAQLVGDDVASNAQASWNTVDPSVMSQRAPGRLVNAGRADFNARHGDTIQRSLFGPTITEVPPPLTLEQQVRIQVLQTIFQNLNFGLTALNTLVGANVGSGTGSGSTSTLTGLTSLLGQITSPI